MNIDKTLDQRGDRYGDFGGHARITQELKQAMGCSRNWDTLSLDKKECLEMVAHKIGRILNGDPEYHDSWHDIIGYVRLVEQTLTPEPAPANYPLMERWLSEVAAENRRTREAEAHHMNLEEV